MEDIAFGSELTGIVSVESVVVKAPVGLAGFGALVELAAVNVEHVECAAVATVLECATLTDFELVFCLPPGVLYS